MNLRAFLTPRIVWFGRTRVRITATGSETTLPDGRVLPAQPQDTPAYRAQAQAIGYGDDMLAMCREHDYLHALLCQALGLPVSPALLGAINGAPTNDLTGAEEDLVLAAQRFLNLWRRGKPC